MGKLPILCLRAPYSKYVYDKGAEAEELLAHARAVSIRLANLNDES